MTEMRDEVYRLLKKVSSDTEWWEWDSVNTVELLASQANFVAFMIFDVLFAGKPHEAEAAYNNIVKNEPIHAHDAVFFWKNEIQKTVKACEEKWD